MTVCVECLYNKVLGQVPCGANQRAPNGQPTRPYLLPLTLLGAPQHRGDPGVCWLFIFLRTPSRAPYRTPPACANRAAYLDPPPVVPDPESIDSQTAYR